MSIAMFLEAVQSRWQAGRSFRFYVGAQKELPTVKWLMALRAWNRARSKTETNLLLMGPSSLPPRGRRQCITQHPREGLRKAPDSAKTTQRISNRTEWQGRFLLHHTALLQKSLPKRLSLILWALLSQDFCKDVHVSCFQRTKLGFAVISWAGVYRKGNTPNVSYIQYPKAQGHSRVWPLILPRVSARYWKLSPLQTDWSPVWLGEVMLS